MSAPDAAPGAVHEGGRVQRPPAVLAGEAPGVIGAAPSYPPLHLEHLAPAPDTHVRVILGRRDSRGLHMGLDEVIVLVWNTFDFCKAPITEHPTILTHICRGRIQKTFTLVTLVTRDVIAPRPDGDPLHLEHLVSALYTLGVPGPRPDGGHGAGPQGPGPPAQGGEAELAHDLLFSLEEV